MWTSRWRCFMAEVAGGFGRIRFWVKSFQWKFLCEHTGNALQIDGGFWLFIKKKIAWDRWLMPMTNVLFWRLFNEESSMLYVGSLQALLLKTVGGSYRERPSSLTPAEIVRPLNAESTSKLDGCWASIVDSKTKRPVYSVYYTLYRWRVRFSSSRQVLQALDHATSRLQSRSLPFRRGCSKFGLF